MKRNRFEVRLFPILKGKQFDDISKSKIIFSACVRTPTKKNKNVTHETTATKQMKAVRITNAADSEKRNVA